MPAVQELAFALPALGIALLSTRRAVHRVRTGALAVLCLLILWEPAEALRWTLSLSVLVIFSCPRGDRLPRALDGALAAVLTALAMLLSFERGMMALGAAGLMSAFALAFGRRTFPARAQLPRFAGYLGGLLATQLVVALLFELLSASYLDYLAQLADLSRAYTVTMRLGDGARHAPLVGLGVCLAGGGIVLTLRRSSALPEGTLLIGAAPTLIAGLVRGDPAHIFLGACVGVAALALVCARRIEARRGGAAGLAAVLVAISLFGLLPTHSAPLRQWLSLAATVMPAERADLERRHREYGGDVRRTARWVSARQRRGPLGCVALDESLGAVHAITGVSGPVGLRWNEALQASRARALSEAACEHAVHRFFALGVEPRWAGWVVGEDFLSLAREYRPAMTLGPSLVVLDRRPSPLTLERRPVDAQGLGTWVELRAGDSLEISFARPVATTSLVRLEVEVGAPRLARGLDRLAVPEVAFLPSDDSDPLSQPLPSLQSDGRRPLLLAPDPWAAEQRWLGDVLPAPQGTVEGMRVRLGEGEGDHALRIRVLSVEEVLPPPAAPTAHAAAGPRDDNLLAHGVGRHASAQPEDGGTRLVAHPSSTLEASFDVHLVPAIGDGLQAELELVEGETESVRVEVLDLAAPPASRRVVLAQVEVVRGTPTSVDLPLDAWEGRAIWVRLVLGPDAAIRIASLRRSHSPVARSLAGLVRAGRATSADHARLSGAGDIMLHPGEPDAAPVELWLPLDPGSDRCLATGLSNRGDRGDGVWMEITAVSGQDEHTLTREHVSPGHTHPLPPLRLPRDADQLVLRVEPGPTRDFDWATFISPARVACPEMPSP